MAGTDLNLLITLDVLLEDGSVAAAARRLGLSASAMSRTLARLREATGDQLLVRAGQGLVPTAHAAALRERVHVLAQDVQAVLRPAGGVLDLASLERSFTLRANEGFVEAFTPRLVAAVTAAAPGVRLLFAPKPDKDARPFRDGLVDLEIGVLGETAPEMRVQSLFRDHFVGAVRRGHPLLDADVTPARYAACGHVTASRRGRDSGPVDRALGALGLVRKIAVVVPSFPAALAVAGASDLVALVPASCLRADEARGGGGREAMQGFALPVRTEGIVISQLWHPRLDADPAHRWLRNLVHRVCQVGID